MRTFLLLVLFTVLSFVKGFSQVNEPYHTKEAVVGDTLSFTVTSLFDVTFKAKDAGLAQIETVINSNTRKLQFFLLPDAGSGVYKAKIECYPTYTQPEYVEFELDFKNSIVKASDDFVWMTSETISIEPLQNDISSLGNAKIKDLSHVLHGSATLENDGSITYTRSPNHDRDYIVYSSVDSLGTYDVATVYIACEPESIEEYKEEQIFAYIGQKEVILLDAIDFNQVTTTEYGELNVVSDFAYTYAPSSIGVDTLVFNKEGASHIYIIHVVDKVANTNSFVVDDEVYTANNTAITFNVFENDKSQQFVITNHSPELTYNGNGVFTYTPDASDEGYHQYSYTVTNGSTTETGMIELVVSDFEPVNNFVYMFNTNKGNSFVVDYDVPIETYSFSIENEPNFGTLTVLGTDAHITTCDTISGANRIVYTPYDGFSGYDQFEVKYCPSSDGVCSIVKIQINVLETDSADCICVDECIWSGDANNDGKVDIKDILTIGKYIGAVGSAREVSEEWTGSNTEDFGVKTAHGTDIKYADCNGDGVINFEDFSAVNEHLGKYHTIQSSLNVASQNVPFFFTTETEEVENGDKYTFKFFLGNATSPIVDLSGISFSLALNSDRLDSSSVTLHEVDGNFFTKHAPHYTGLMQPSAGKIHIGMIKTNARTSNGFGHISTVSCIIEDEAIGVRPVFRSASDILEVSVSDISVLDGNGYHFGLEGSTQRYDLSSDSTDETKEGAEISIYPNPVKNHVRIVGITNPTCHLYDMMGRLVLHSQNNTIDVSNITDGIYTLIITDAKTNSRVTKRIAVTK